MKVSLCAFIFFRYFGKGKKKINENLKKKTEKIKAKQKPQSPPVLKNFPV